MGIFGSSPTQKEECKVCNGTGGSSALGGLTKLTCKGCNGTGSK